MTTNGKIMTTAGNVTIVKRRRGRSSVCVDGVAMAGVTAIEFNERRGDEAEVVIHVIGRMVKIEDDSDESRILLGDEVHAGR